MAHYLVIATPQGDLEELKAQLASAKIRELRPFGKALHHSLTNARTRQDGRAVWEGEDYCSPPLAMEREAVLDRFFTDIQVERVDRGEGWARVEALPMLWDLR